MPSKINTLPAQRQIFILAPPTPSRKVTTMQSYRNYVNGEWLNSESGATLESLNPSTGEPVARVQSSTVSDTYNAIDSASEAFEKGDWRKSSASQRSKVLIEIASAVEKNLDQLARILTLENGKPFRFSQGEIRYTSEIFQYFASVARSLSGDVPDVGKDALSLTLREPVGVCAIILPWDNPVNVLAYKVAPALAAGCTVVIKPSSLTPASDLAFMHLISLLKSIPKGVVNMITGNGSVIGSELCKSSKVNLVSFTGSTEVGKSIMESASSTLKRVVLECGGKSPNIVFPDANITKAIPAAIWGAFRNTGQVCTAASRLLLHNKILEDFVGKLVSMLQPMKVGDGLAPDTDIGPLISRGQLETSLDYVQVGRNEGANVRYGGNRLTENGLEKGHFMKPAVLTNVSNHMRVAQEEVFGPVLSVIGFETEEEAIEIANDTPYGLAAAIWSNDITRAIRMTRSIRAGTVWVNTYAAPRPIEGPFGGFKQSGVGRELGLRDGLNEYLEPKHVTVSLSESFSTGR